MACNLVFNKFLSLGKGGNSDANDELDALAKRFQFGRTLVLRSPKGSEPAATHQFEPVAIRAEEAGSVVPYAFAELPVRHGVPYVTAKLEIPVNGQGFLASTTPPEPRLTAATAYWPAADPKIKTLAEQITRGETGNDRKAAAILRWLAPGINISYSGETGSRWGTAKVLEQKFGHCWDFSDCFVTLCRAAGVPSRQVAGWLYGSSGHVWAEYYREGKGWQQVDPTGGGELPCGIYHIAYFTSEDGEMPIVYLSTPQIEAQGS
jgi:transglutaminase-like putative cysteine protease